MASTFVMDTLPLTKVQEQLILSFLRTNINCRKICGKDIIGLCISKYRVVKKLIGKGVMMGII